MEGKLPDIRKQWDIEGKCGEGTMTKIETRMADDNCHKMNLMQ